MANKLVPFSLRSRPWDLLGKEMEGMMRNMLDWDGDYNDRELGFAPSLNISETENGYEVTVDLPGVDAKDLNVEFKDDSLCITGERRYNKQEKGKTYHRVEREFGRFRRVIRLGTDVNADSIKADYVDGVLIISAAKTEMSKPKTIEVNA